MGKVKNFPPYEEAKRIVKEKGIKSVSEYKAKYKELGLPSTPAKAYKDTGWIDWPSFFGKERIVFPSYEEAKRIVIKAGVKSWEEYMTKYKELGLPSSPNTFYKEEWIDWPSFFGRETIIYPSYEGAREIVMKAGIKSEKEYKTKCKELGLPSNPNTFYKEEWIDWPSFFGRETIIYPSYEGAREIVMKAGIKSGDEYRRMYKELKLPSSPESFYKGKGWIDWNNFLGKDTIAYPSYENAKRIVKENGVKSKTEYQSKYKELGLPSNPNTFYKEEWIDWADFLGKPHKTSPMERKTKVLSRLAINPILLCDKAPLQVIYMVASCVDKGLANEIEDLLNTTSYEDRMNWVKEQLKTLKVDTSTTPGATSEEMEGEIPAMESMLEVFEDSMDELPDDVISTTPGATSEDMDGEILAMESMLEVFEDSMDELHEDDISNINTILENYYHNLINKELIEEYDG